VACFVYSPRGTGAVAKLAPTMCQSEGDRSALASRYAGLVYRASLQHPQLAGYSHPARCSSRCRERSGERGAVGRVAARGPLRTSPRGHNMPGLQRQFAVRSPQPRSAASARPYRSITGRFGDPAAGVMRRIVLIDDVVTKGTDAARRSGADASEVSHTTFAPLRSSGRWGSSGRSNT